MTGSLRTSAAGRLVFPALVLIAVLAGYAAATNATPVRVWIFVLVLAGWVISLCLHEFAHSAVALAGGDTSVRARGYLTLNPFRYLNAAYSIVIPVIILVIGGIPLPGGAVLIEQHRLRKKSWSSLVSFAGPATNFVIGAVLLLVVKATFTVTSGLYYGLSFLVLLQFLTAILNILPVPGFDGFGIIAPYLSPSAQRMASQVRGWAPLVVFIIIFSIPQASGYLFRPAYWLMDQLGGDRNAAEIGASLFQFWR